MVAGRYLRWQTARRKVAWIVARLDEGKTVYVVTATRATPYDARHRFWFKASRSGAFVARGRAWDCIDFCSLRVVS